MQIHGEVHPKQKKAVLSAVSLRMRKERVSENQCAHPDFDNLVAGFILYQKSRGIRQISNIKSNLMPLRNFLASKDMHAHEMKTTDAQDYLTWLSTLQDANGEPHYASLTMKGLIANAKNLFRYMKNIGLTYTNPFLVVKLIRISKELPKDIPSIEVLNKGIESMEKFWDKETVREIKRFYRVHVLATVQYASGLRLGELRALTESDVDLERKILIVRDGKGGKNRTAYLSEYAAKVLGIYMREMKDIFANDGYLFEKKSTAGLSNIYHLTLREVFGDVGYEHFTSHVFRHALGCHLLKRGCDLRFIALILGHEDLNSTVIYTKVEKEDLKKVIDENHPRSKMSQAKP